MAFATSLIPGLDELVRGDDPKRRAEAARRIADLFLQGAEGFKPEHVEFFDDVDGNRTGFEGVYTAVTAGLRFEPRPGFIIRPELRFDYNFESKPFEDKHGMGTATTDFIVRW